jgi:molecular chaperone HtpG
MKTHNFQVNLEGVISLLSNHLYSSPKVFVRELAQNAVDAITARQKKEPDLKGVIRVQAMNGEMPTLVFEDNGIGLTPEEVHEFLSSIGSSSKRENGRGSDDFIGQFGIGLLSAFMVTDEIVMITRSAKGGPAIEWKGCSDGTYSIKLLEGDHESGTKVFIRAKAGSEDVCSPVSVRRLLKYYCDLLPTPILFSEDNGPEAVVNRMHVPFLDKASFTPEYQEEIAGYGREIVEGEVLASIPLSTRNGKTTGVAYVLGNSVSLARRIEHRVYMKRMLLSDENREILPEWAFFVKAVINTSELRPTASRETLYQDNELSRVNKQMGRCIRDYLLELNRTDPDLLERIIRKHQTSIKTLALHDSEFFRIVIRYLRFPSTVGDVTIPQYREHSREIRHIFEEEMFNKVKNIAQSHGIPVINSRYDNDRELLNKLGEIYEGITVTETDLGDIMQHLEELAPEEYARIEPLLQLAEEELEAFRAKPAVRKFLPAEIPSLHYPDETMVLERRAEYFKNRLSPLWVRLMKGVAGSEGRAVLYLNYDNALVRQMMEMTDREMLRHFIRLVYIQALLIGNYQLGSGELTLLTEGLSGLLASGLGRSQTKKPEDEKKGA